MYFSNKKNKDVFFYMIYTLLLHFSNANFRRKIKKFVKYDLFYL